MALWDATKCYLKGNGSATPTACDATTCQAFSCKTLFIWDFIYILSVLSEATLNFKLQLTWY